MAHQEIKALTGLRGVSALYVVVFHFYQFCMPILTGRHDLLSGKYSASLFTHGYLAVDVFFILSAFVITLSSSKLFEGKFNIDSYKIFMRKRWVRLYPSYFIVAVYGFIVVEHFHRVPNFIISLTLLNLVFGLSHILGHLWSLGAEWITYLVYPVFYKISHFSKKGFWKYLLIISGVLFLGILGITHGKGGIPDYMLELYQGYPCLFRCFADYLIGIGGYLIYKGNGHRWLYSNRSSLILFTAIVATLCFPKADIITVILCMLLIINISKDQSLIARLLSTRIIYFLGIISYPLYLINSLVFLELDALSLFLNTHLNLFNVYGIGAVFIALCVILATMLTYLVEMPVISYLTRFFTEGKLFTRKNSFPSNNLNTGIHLNSPN